MIRKFIAYYKPYRVSFIINLFAALMISFLGLLYPILTRQMLNDYIPNMNMNMIIIGGLILLGSYLVRMLLRFWMQYNGHMIGVKIQRDMRLEMFHKLQKLPYKYFDDHETGEVLSKLVDDLNPIVECAHHIPTDFFTSVVMLVGSFIFLASIDLMLTLVVFMCIPILVFITIKTRKQLSSAFKEARVGMAMVNTSMESSVTGIRVTKAYTNSDIEYDKFKDNISFLVGARRKGFKALGIFLSSSSFVTDLFNVVLLIVGGYSLYLGRISFGDFSSFIISINLFIGPVNTLIRLVEQYQSGMAGFERFVGVLGEDEEVDDKDATALLNARGDIEFSNVSFSYDGSENVLEDISFKIDAGKSIALVGASGGGKTTICSLLMRFYEKNAGEIKIDGKKIEDYTYHSLRNNIGIVQQDVFLFSGSIYDNIVYGRPDASHDQVIEAAKQANIHDFVLSLKDGYNTEIGERGIKLSGGQKQRISLARMFLKNPKILILDEATSALDNTTENLIQKELDELCKNRTTIVVAHRLSTVKNVDHIMVIGKKILEEGYHEDLISKGGIYNDLYNMQFKKIG
ncbi:ABC transporter ATP-binding protein [Acidaminobacter sp. JC074]|uniref:ABC transporter ATP-binding protein n=1 Tax=Acidaminobacter sp. JC074 TaxID=2530199 RepID=UPI001F10C30B|nr:ABC transporter ATP-binding protein [Acidaminobacter sp. JC074]MCH4886403.1 ABC transporter ATP-binding protein [Acidaminobacter sp. JC074]